MRLKHRAELAAVRTALGMIEILPEAGRQALGKSAGRLYYRFGGSRRAIAIENLKRAFPQKTDRELETLARACAERFGTVFFDFLAATNLTAPELLSRISVEGDEGYRKARARGRGVFLLSAHFGNWEIGALAAGLLDRPIASVVRPLDNPLLERDLARRRSRFGNRIISKRKGAREILRQIHAGETVAILIDQNVLAREAVFVPFFGRLAATTPALGLFQRKTDAAVVPVFCRPTGRGRYTLTFEEPILLEKIPESGRTPEALTARYTAVTEEVVRRQPELWLWMHNRWRTRPPNEAA
jgi:KDO2-lipid IV(A) lauroyltransferase